MSSAGAPPERDVEVISPLDQRVYSVKTHELDAYKKAGWITAQAEAGVDTPAIAEHFNGWTGAGKSLLVSAASGVPLLNTAISHLSTAENAKYWAENVKAAEDEHPYLDMFGRVAGTGAALVGGAALAGLAAPVAAAGLGAEALGAGALGAEAAGAGGAALAGGAEAAGGLAAAAGEGAGAAVEAGAGNWVSALKTGLGGEKLAGVAARGAAANVALGQVARIDDASIRHALDPDGQEKLSFSMGDILFDAALGGGTSVVLGKAGQWLGKMGKSLDSDGLKKLTDAMFEEDKQLANKLAGRDAEFYQAATELVGKPRDEVGRLLKNRKDIIKKSMNGLKIQVDKVYLGAGDVANLRTELQATLGDTEAWKGTRGADALLQENGHRLDVEGLQKVRRLIQSKTTWGDVTARAESNAKFKAGGELVTKYIHGIFERADVTGGKQLAQEWATLDKNYSVNEMLRSALKKGVGAAPMGAVARSVINAGGVGAAIGGTLKATMGYGGGAVTGGVFAAGTKAAYMLKPEHFAKATRLLGKVFVEADKKLVGAVEKGLYGAPGQFHTVFHPQRYQDLAAKVAMARAEPEESYANAREELTKAGVPDTIADDIATRHHAIRQYLGDQLPKNTVAPGVVTRGHGDPVQQRQWLGQAETARNPAYGIAHPTPKNLEVLRQFYPHNLYQAQQAAETHVQNNPHMPLAAKMYASRLAGRPLSILSTPAFSQSLAGAREEKQQAQQQQQQGRGTGGRKAVSSGQGSGTRLDGLQNGGA